MPSKQTMHLRLLRHASLALIKATVGMFGSKALLADACRNGSEAVVSFIQLYGMRWSKRPARRTPSHVRWFSESTLTIVTIVLMFVIGVEIGISAVKEITAGSISSTSTWAWAPLVTIVLATVFTHLLFPVRVSKGEVVPLVIVLLGASLSGIGQVEPKLEFLSLADPIASLFLVGVLFLHGYKLAQLAVARSVGVEENPSDLDEFRAAALRIEGVVSVEELSAREMGHYVVAEMTICVNPRITVYEGQEIARRVRHFIMQRFGHITELDIVVVPYDPRYPYKSNTNPNEETYPTLLQ